MPGSLTAFLIFVILLPGFSAAYIVQSLSARRPQTDLERVIEALVFSFLIYACHIAIASMRGYSTFSTQHKVQGINIDHEVLNIPLGSQDISLDIAWLAGMTLLFAFALVAYNRFDGNRIFRLIGLAEKTSKTSTWDEVLENEAIPGQPVQVALADGRSVLGSLLYYSNNAEDTSLFLSQAAWIDPAGQAINIPGPGILLTKESGIQAISLLDPGPAPTAVPGTSSASIP